MGRLLGELGRLGRQLAVAFLYEEERLGQSHLQEEAEADGHAEAAGVRHTSLAIEVAAWGGGQGATQLFELFKLMCFKSLFGVNKSGSAFGSASRIPSK